MSFVKLNISFSRTLSEVCARFGCIISPLCEITLSTGAELAGRPRVGHGSIFAEQIQSNPSTHGSNPIQK